MTQQLTIQEVNHLDQETFLKIFGNIVENRLEVAENIYKKKPFDHQEEPIKALNNYLDSLPLTEKKEVLKGYPSLGAKVKLTAESENEHMAAGLKGLNSEESRNLDLLNERYLEKFGFPFVICAKMNNKSSIITAIEIRLLNSKEEEIQLGINEVKKIGALRLKDVIGDIEKS